MFENYTEIKRLPKHLLTTVPGLLVVAGMFTFRPEGTGYSTVVLEVCFFLAGLFLLPVSDSRAVRLLLALGAYVIGRFVIGISDTHAPFSELLRSHKWILYLMILTPFVGKAWGSMASLVRLTKIVMPLVVLKYFLIYFLDNQGFRPNLLTENNFELSLFAGLIVVAYAHLGRWKFIYVVLFGMAVAVSGSRSAGFAFIVLVLYAGATLWGKSSIRQIAWLAFASVSMLVPVLVIQQRGTSLDTLDRINFLNHFLANTQNWTAWNWAFGTPPLTPLSDVSCAALSFYAPLFADDGSGTCYVVILHSFLLRVVFDSGLFGLALAFVSMWLLMSWARVKPLIRWTILAIVLTNSASVSGLNNVYVALPIGLAILSARWSYGPLHDELTGIDVPEPTAVMSGR